jgi:hypothetical protein
MRFNKLGPNPIHLITPLAVLYLLQIRHLITSNRFTVDHQAQTRGFFYNLPPIGLRSIDHTRADEGGSWHSVTAEYVQSVVDNARIAIVECHPDQPLSRRLV